MPLKAAPVWALLGPNAERPESWGVRVDVTNLGTSGIAKMYIYGEIGPWGVDATDVLSALQGITGPVEVHINSMGGSVFEGLAIYQALVEHPHDVTVVIDGLAASAASFIAMAGTTIEIGSAAHVMIHNASSICMGTAEDMEASAIMLRQCSAAIASLYAKRSGRDAADFAAAMDAETWYVGQEAIDAGLADSIRGDVEEEPEFAAATAAPRTINLAALPDPPVMRNADGPDSTEEEPQRERPVETDGNTPTDSSPGEDDPGGEIDIWEQLDPGGKMLAWFEDDDQPAGLFGHLTKGAAQ